MCRYVVLHLNSSLICFCAETVLNGTTESFVFYNFIALIEVVSETSLLRRLVGLCSCMKLATVVGYLLVPSIFRNSVTCASWPVLPLHRLRIHVIFISAKFILVLRGRADYSVRKGPGLQIFCSTAC